MKSAMPALLLFLVALVTLAACSDAPALSLPSPVAQGARVATVVRATQTRAVPLVASPARVASTVPTTAIEATALVSATIAPSSVITATADVAELSATVFNGGNVRETPVTGRPLDQINAHETVRLLGKNDDGTWYLVTNIRGVTGWVSSTLLTIDPAVGAQVAIAPASAVAIAPGAQPNLGQSPVSAAVPSGFRVQQVGPIQLTLPSSWQTLPLGRADLERIAATTETDNPHLAQIARQLFQSNQYQYLRFAAAESSTRNAVTSSARLVALPRDPAQSTNQSLDGAIKQWLQSLPAVSLLGSNTQLKLNGLDGARLVYDLPVRQPDGGATIARNVQWYLIDGTNIDVLTITGVPDPSFVPLADTIAASLKTNAPAPQPTSANAPPSAVVSFGRVTSAGKLRSAPVLAANTVLGQVCPDDQMALIVAQERNGTRWYRVRVLATGPDCGANRVQIGAEGWLTSNLVALTPDG